MTPPGITVDDLRNLKTLARECGYHKLANEVQSDIERLQRKQSCNKIRHRTQARAEAQISQLKSLGNDRKNEDDLVAYECSVCKGFWHVGHNRNK